MIPITEFRKSFEKNANVGKTVLKGLGKTFSFMGEHPKATLSALGIALATGGTLAVANKVHPLHQIVREETKSKAIGEQTRILSEILKAQKKAVAAPGQKLVKPALS